VATLRTLVVAPVFENRPLVYRTGEASYELDPYAEFLVAPSRQLVQPITAYLRLAGVFRDVSERDSAVKPDHWLEVYVTELYGDFRPNEEPAAVFSMRVLLLDPTRAPPHVLVARDYSRRVAIPQRAAAALVAGWNTALEQIMDEVAADVKAARK
jgi:hypothetical protein